MKNVLAVLAIMIVIGVVLWLLFQGGIGFGKGVGKEEQDNNASAVTEQKETVKEEKKIMETEENKQADEDSGENVYVINVVGSDYFYENERVDLDSFVNKIDKVKETAVVEVKDDNASLRAYNELVKQLKEKKIKFIEQ